MSRAKEDAPPKEGANSDTDNDPTPTIEETLDAPTAKFLTEVDAVSSQYAKELKANWIGIRPTDRTVLAREVRRIASAGFHSPAHAASHADLHRSTPSLAWKAEK